MRLRGIAELPTDPLAWQLPVFLNGRMLTMLVSAIVLAGAALAVQGRRGFESKEIARVAVLFAAGLFTAGPFLSERWLGAGDSMNYSDAVADTVVQLRQGVFPVLVGQSEYAFNGRVHPLRSAPLFTYAAGALDALTVRRLDFWGLQNGVLALSLISAFLVTYLCLRPMEGVDPWRACWLALAYGFSPALLAAAYGQDLYMSVVAAPFIPVAILGAVRVTAARSTRDYALMAVGLAGLWLAHPPIAAWMSLGCTVVVAAAWAARLPRMREIVGVTAAAALGGVLSAYVFVSALGIGESVVTTGTRASKEAIVDRLEGITRQFAAGSFRPVGVDPTNLDSFQLGYGLWILAAAAFLAAWRRRGVVRVLAAVIGLFLALVLPVPVLHRQLWLALPFQFLTMTNIWPMQRAYLVLSGWIVFAAAAGLAPLHWPQSATRRRAVFVAIALVLAWSVTEAGAFVEHGFRLRRGEVESERIHRAENINLTVTAYSLLAAPSTFTHGTVDPEHEFRLLRPGDGREIADNWTGSSRPPKVVSRGVLKIAAGDRNLLHLEPLITIQPDLKYEVRFRFLTKPFEAMMFVSGGTVLRDYRLPSYVGAHGFGMETGNNPALVLWTTAPAPSTVEVTLASADPAMPLSGDLAEFTLEEVDRDALPIKLLELSPELRCRVRAPEQAWLSTPRLFIRGYEASVDGSPARVARSDDGLVLVSVPPGEHEVVLCYRGFPLLRETFYAGLVGWAAVGIFGIACAAGWVRAPSSGARTASTPRTRGRTLASSIALAVAAGAAVLIPAFVRWRAEGALVGGAGPLHMRLWLPVPKLGTTQALMSAGKAPEESMIFIRYRDRNHIEIGLDAGHKGYAVSAPLEVSYNQKQDLVMSYAALYPAGRPELSGLPAAELDWLRSTVRIWLNGHEVVTRRLEDFDPDVRTVTIADTNQLREDPKRFTGDVESVERLPVSAAEYPFTGLPAVLSGAGPVGLRLFLPPYGAQKNEPLIAMGHQGSASFVFVRSIDATHVQVGLETWGSAAILGDPVEVDRQQAQRVEVTAPALFPDENPNIRRLPDDAKEWLRHHVTIEWNGKTVLRRRIATLPAGGGEMGIGINRIGSSLLDPVFTGVVVGVERLPVAGAGFPILPLAGLPGAVGPLRLELLLPTDQTGHAQPLLTTGKPGAGMFLFIRYIDGSHVRIGLDIWGGAVLVISDPIAIDYAKPHECVLSCAALYPEAEAKRAGIPSPETRRLRGQVEVRLDGQTVLHKEAFTFDSDPAAITVGRSRIGGSNTEPEFTGDILASERLPVPLPSSH